MDRKWMLNSRDTFMVFLFVKMYSSYILHGFVLLYSIIRVPQKLVCDVQTLSIWRYKMSAVKEL